MAEFKKGDRVIVSSQYYSDYNGTGVIEDVGLSRYGVRMDGGHYIAAEFKNVKHYKEDTVAVKVGDRMIVTGTIGHLIPMGSEVTVIDIGNNSSVGCYRVVDKVGFEQWVCHSDLKPISPPQKIQQNGYEYKLVGPVKPEWLVDGAWVVDKETGRKYHVSCKNRAYMFNNGTREVIIDFASLPTRLRPHTSSDWKWGDWAMYDGKRVFVIKAESKTQHAMISCAHYPTGLKYIPVSELTPTF